MMIFNFYTENDNSPRYLIGSIEGYSARSAYLHLTGRELQHDILTKEVFYTIGGSLQDYQQQYD